MPIIRYSSIIFYNSQNKVLIQDRRNLGKDDKEWSFFWGWSEWNESPIETILREIREETALEIDPKELHYLWKVIRDSAIENRISEWNTFITPWKSEYDTVFEVLEGAGYEWVSLQEMRLKKTYDAQFIMIGFAEIYLYKNNA